MSGKVPPSSRAGRSKRFADIRSPEFRKAARIYERFTGHDVVPIETITVPPLPSHVAVIGHVDAICYTTKRDGKTEKYIHTFARVDRPMMGISPDGKQILLIDGNYDFTDRGIVDASDWRTRSGQR